jgi:oligoribonuclease NrnB/cAMP/cGMP phosphodiesterase (DHH superfamily)
MAFLEQFPEGEVEFHNHNSIDDRFAELALDPETTQESYDAIIIADISLGNPDFFEQTHSSFPPGYLRCFDHHNDREYLNELDGCVHDHDRCGGLITAEELGCSEALQDFAAAVDLHDRWQEDAEEFEFAQNLSRLHHFVGQQEFIARGPELSFSDPEWFVVQGIISQEKRDAARFLKNCVKGADASNNRFIFVVNCSPIVAHHIYETVTDFDYVMSWDPLGKKMSMYSAPDKTNVGEIAKRYGGGGHDHAAGFPVPVEVLPYTIQTILSGGGDLL